MEEHATALAEAIEAALPGWVERSVVRVLEAWSGTADGDVRAAAADAGHRAAAEVGSEVRTLLALDVDEQRNTPLTILRGAVRYPTEVLRSAGVPPVVRDDFKERAFPDDDYDLAPASFADVDPALNDLGIAWGAAKAMAHRARHGGWKVIAYVPDLMDRSKVAAAANDIAFVSDPAKLAALADDVRLVVVDLNRPGVLDVLPSVTAPTIGFGSHVQRDLLDAARAAGCELVLPRSEFFRRLPELLGTS